MSPFNITISFKLEQPSKALPIYSTDSGIRIFYKLVHISKTE